MTTDRTRVPFGSAVWAALGTGALVAVALWLPRDLAVASLVYVIVLGILAARLLVRAVVSTTSTTLTAGPRPFDLAFRKRPARATDTLADPRQIAFELRSSLDVPSTLHFRLRPRLRAIAEDRLAAEHGLSLDLDPDASRRLLGDEAWELLREDRKPPTRRQGGAISQAEVERIVSAIERL
jgi:hypothetical protein